MKFLMHALIEFDSDENTRSYVNNKKARENQNCYQ